MCKFLIIILFASFNVMAANNCPISNSSELFALVKKNHPQILLNDAELESLKGDIEVAKQRVNPEFDGQSTLGDSLGRKIYTTSVSLKHTFELGSKRDARINLASKGIEFGKEVTRNQNENALIDSIVKLHRLRQIYELIPIYKEALETFKKIHRNFVKRKSLSPQQQVEKETLGLAISDYKLNVSQLEAEQVNLNRHLSFFLGLECTIPFKALPTKIFSKSKIENDSFENYSKLSAAKKMVEVANAEYERESSLAIPNVQIGPVYEFEKDGIANTQTVGIALTMDIPFLNTNSGGKARALKGVSAARIRLRNTQMESQIDLKSWQTKYLNFSGSLKGIASRNELEKKHHKIEALFKRGIISTSLVIESHRQLISFYITRFEFEKGAVEALWNIYKINGEFNKYEI